VERPKAIHLLYHPWILLNEKPNTPATPKLEETNSSTLVKNYLQKVVVKTDIVPKSSVSTSLLKSKSPTSSKSKPFLSKLNTKPTTDHKHNLTTCSFPDGKLNLFNYTVILFYHIGTVQCKLCSMDISGEAYVCKDFCGFLSHCACYDKVSIMINLSQDSDLIFIKIATD
jgi:hypothetical protein